MALDGTDFVDTDLRTSGGSSPRLATAGQSVSAVSGRAPTREELDSQLTATQQDLAKLREAQEQLERAKAATFYMPVGTIGRVFMEIEQDAFSMS